MVLEALALPVSLVTLVPLVLLQALALPRPLAPMAFIKGPKGLCRMWNAEEYFESAEWRLSDRAHAHRKWLRCELIVLEQMLLAGGMTAEEVIENRAEWRQLDPIVGPPSPRPVLPMVGALGKKAEAI